MMNKYIFMKKQNNPNLRMKKINLNPMLNQVFI